MPKQHRPLRWLEQASAQEIGEALLAVDEVKAARVTAYLMSRAEPEIQNIVDNARSNLERDPLGTIGGALLGLSRGGGS